MTIQAEIRQLLKHVPKAGKNDMKISDELATHEAGHLVVGLRIGLDEQGIEFFPAKPGEAARAWWKDLDQNPRRAITRSFSGLLAQIHLLPDSIAADMRRAYEHSIIIVPDHPCFHEISPSDREFLSGAKDDMGMAWTRALKFKNGDEKQALAYLRKLELKTRPLVVECAANILHVVKDIHLWASEPDREFEAMALYPGYRAEAVLQKL